MTPPYPEPRPAATVVIIRQGASRPEVFMVRRHSKAVFASHYVFPGGVVDASDRDVKHLSTGVSEECANASIGLADGAIDYYSAAIREAFEESGVLFARNCNGGWAFADESIDAGQVEHYRAQLNTGEVTWRAFLEQHDFRPALDSLHYISYWVTPRVRDKRFSTRFFLAVIPDGQIATHDDGELTDSCWMTPDEVLQAGKQGAMKLMYPTYSTLSEIARYDTVQQIVEWARRRAETGDARLLPAFVEIDGKDAVVMPGSEHYPGEFDT